MDRSRQGLPYLDEIADRLRAAGCVWAREEAALLDDAADSPAHLLALVAARVAGAPLEHLLGWSEFHGRRYVVAPGVFVPRARSELLVDATAARVPDTGQDDVVLVDLCCGSGAVGAAIGHVLRSRGVGVQLYAADVDPRAADCARVNLVDLLGATFVGDMYAALPPDLRGEVDVLVANVPYVPTDRIPFMPSEARDHEPRVALDGGPDGLDLARRFVGGAAFWLRPGGIAAFEVSTAQVDTAVGIVEATGLTAEVVTDDELDATVLVGTRGGEPA